MTTIAHSTEFMKNQKAASMMSAPSSFDTAQTSDGNALFFSIDEEGKFFLCAEQEQSRIGWNHTDLCKCLGADDDSVSAKAFAVSQHEETHLITIAVAVRPSTGDSDTLYLLTDLPNDPEAEWITSEKQQWQACPFDAKEGGGDKLDIAYISLARRKGGSDPLHVVVGVPNPDELGIIQNYTVKKSTGGPSWEKFQTAEEYDEMLGMEIGQSGLVRGYGLYELYTIDGKQSLTFTRFGSARGIVKWVPPTGASALAAVPTNDNGDTDLFVACDGQIQLYPADEQTSSKQGHAIVVDDVVTGVKDLCAYATSDEIVLTGSNSSGELFHTRCPRDKMKETASWSPPVPIRTQVHRLSAFVDETSGLYNVFAHVGDIEMMRYTRDPVTTSWGARSILLPAPDHEEYVEHHTYTTRISVQDDNGNPDRTAELSVTAASPCNVYVNNCYTTLGPSAPVSITPDNHGCILIVQEADGLCAVDLKVQCGDGPVTTIQPMELTRGRIVDTKDITAVSVTNEKGDTQQLVASTISDDTTNAVSTALDTLLTKVDVPGNGPSAGNGKENLKSDSPTAEVLWAISHRGGDVQVHEGEAANRVAGLVPGPDGTLSFATAEDGIFHWLEAAAGEVFSWANNVINDVEQTVEDIAHCVVKLADGAYHFCLKVGEKAYSCAVNCLTDVMQVADFLFKQLEILAEKLIAWLGYIFNWPEIIQTKNVIYKMVELAKDSTDDVLDDLKGYITYAAAHLEAILDQVGGLDPDSDVWGKKADDLKNTPSEPSSPQAQQAAQPQQSPVVTWITDHVLNSIELIRIEYQGSDSLGKEIGGMLKDLFGTSVESIEQASEEIYDNVIKPLMSSSEDLLTIFRSLAAIISKFFVDELGALATGFVDACKIAVDAVWDIITAEVKIPVLTELYKKVISPGSTLSVLDVCCLMGAIPAEVGGKLMGMPRPKDESFNKLKDASTFQEFMQIMHKEELPSNANTVGLVAKQGATADSSSSYEGARFATKPNLASWYTVVTQFTNALTYIGIGFCDLAEYTVSINPAEEATEGITSEGLKNIRTLGFVCRAVQTVTIFVANPIVSLSNMATGAAKWLVLFTLTAVVSATGLAAYGLFKMLPGFFSALGKLIPAAVANAVLTITGVIWAVLKTGLMVWNYVDMAEHPEVYSRGSGGYDKDLEIQDIAIGTGSLGITALRNIVVPLAMFIGPCFKDGLCEPEGGTEVAGAIILACGTAVVGCDLFATAMSGLMGMAMADQVQRGYSIWSISSAPWRDIKQWTGV